MVGALLFQSRCQSESVPETPQPAAGSEQPQPQPAAAAGSQQPASSGSGQRAASSGSGQQAVAAGSKQPQRAAAAAASRQQAAGSRQQAAGSKQQAASSGSGQQAVAAFSRCQEKSPTQFGLCRSLNAVAVPNQPPASRNWLDNPQHLAKVVSASDVEPPPSQLFCLFRLRFRLYAARGCLGISGIRESSAGFCKYLISLAGSRMSKPTRARCAVRSISAKQRPLLCWYQGRNGGTASGLL